MKFFDPTATKLSSRAAASALIASRTFDREVEPLIAESAGEIRRLGVESRLAYVNVGILVTGVIEGPREPEHAVIAGVGYEEISVCVDGETGGRT